MMREKQVKRFFIPGDQWLYYKIYCGEKTADMLLIDYIKPLIDRLIGNKLVKQWFFIRYNDPEHHIRLRFFLKDVAKTGEIISVVHSVFEKLIMQDVVWNVQIDTYKREIERYGLHTMVLTEKIFCIDSDFVLRQLGHQSDERSRLYYTLLHIEHTLQLFRLNYDQRKLFISANCSAFKKEFSANKMTNRQLEEKFKTHQDTLLAVLEAQDSKYEQLVKQQSLKNKKLTATVQNLLHEMDANDLNHYIANHLHMTINRVFHSHQRQYEMLCYDFMERVYRKWDYSKTKTP